MATDVILDDEDGNWLTLSAAVIHGTASDFILASPARRSSPSGFRRALVHDFEDGLTINFNSDYPGGVTINSVTRISPKEPTGGIDPVRLRTVPELVIDGGVRFVWDQSSSVRLGPATEEVSLQAVIEELRSEIDALKDRVAALGG
jgi:hypothetical protein